LSQVCFSGVARAAVDISFSKPKIGCNTGGDA
jgi:hypothetical protein